MGCGVTKEKRDKEKPARDPANSMPLPEKRAR